MVRSSGDHLKRHEVKAGIIDFILKSNEAIREPDIREKLRNDYGIVDQGNIKTHLRDLQHRFSCIEKFTPNKQDPANKWEIRRLEHVRNIRLYFPEIQLKTYEKALKIILRRFFIPYPESPMANMFRVQLLLSDSLFDMCTKTDSEIVYDRSYKLYKYSFEKWGKGYPEWEQRILEDMSRVRIINTLMAMKETSSKHNITEAEELKTNFETAAKMIKDDAPERMSYLNERDKSGKLFEMNLPMYIGPVLIETMFDHCFDRDITDGTVSPEEIEFVNETKKMHAYFKAHPEISLFSELQAYDNFYIKYFEKYRKGVRIQ